MSRQEDEISALESIFNEDEILQSKELGPSAGQFCALIEMPADFHIVYKVNEDDVVTVPNIIHLPPIILHYSLPNDYPTNPNSPPTFTLTCQWLTRRQLSKLCKNLDKLWKESQVDDAQGTEILYIWAQFLKNESLTFLKLPNNILNISSIEQIHLLNVKGRPRLNQATTAKETDVTPTHSRIEGSVAPHQNMEAGSKCNKAQASTAKSRQRRNICELDCRAVLDLSISSTLSDYLIDYNEKKLASDFAQQFHMCNICYISKKGSHCSRFIPCNHIFCDECTRSYFTVNIKDGKVQNIKCPETKCNSEATFNQIKALISPELFAKYDALLLDATLDSLGDIVICPRPGCQYTVTRERDEKLANCFQCRYAFCVECRMGYHGVEPCRFKSNEEQRLVKEYTEGTAEERSILEKRYSKKRLDTLVDSTLTKSWISDNSKTCPHCKVAIEKSYGCNKITCWKCGTHFCWICSSRLDPNFPYIHFSQSTSPCYQQLFQGVEEEDPEAAEEENLDLIDDELDVMLDHELRALGLW